MKPEILSLWIATQPGPSFPRLQEELEVDVAIVGAGITGITAALLLKERGLKIALIEALKIGRGVTGHTTAHLTEALDARYYKLIADFGKERTRLVAQSQRVAIEQIAQWVKNYHLDCGFEFIPGYLYTENQEGEMEIEKEAEAATELGLSVNLVQEPPLPFALPRALRFENQAQFHPREYLLPLAQRIAGDGSYVFEESRVLRVVDGSPCVVETELGKIKAQHVIEATHAPLNKFFLQTKTSSATYRSYVSAVKIKNAPPPGLFWDTENPYHYLRCQTIGKETLWLVGGEDHKVGKEQNTLAAYERLERYIRERFELESIRYHWSAQVLEPTDGLPYIGLNPHCEHVYVATGFAGNGMTYGTFAALLLTDLILGIRNPWAEIFKPKRLPSAASIKDFISENIGFPIHFFKDRLQIEELDHLGQIQRGEGKVVQIQGEKIAAYRDPQGSFHLLSPVCTHLGCIVRWNNAEKSWDCPCHGSRFDTSGEILNGPAVQPLKKKKFSEIEKG